MDLDINEIVIENSKDPTHGDYATNVALKMARNFSKAPRDVANLIVEKLNKDDFLINKIVFFFFL